MKTTLGVLMVVRNEELFINHCIGLLLPYVDEIIVVDNGSSDFTRGNIVKNKKVKVFSYPYEEPINMGLIRTFALNKCTTDWFLQCDADEYYPKKSIKKIREAIENPKDAISFRVPYHNLAWRPGYVQANFRHYPDRLYKTDVVDKYEGLLPNDMTKTKEKYYNYRPFLEYDNANDESFENPRQPIIDTPFYHLARTRGYHHEYSKWFRYQKNLHPKITNKEADEVTMTNQWVSGLYDMVKYDPPENVPCLSIPKPKVSIVITNFNYDQYILETLDSCKKQTHKPYEIVVVDDHSSDSSYKLLSNMDDIIFVPHTFTQDVAKCRNEGISKTTGDYFICLDADDRLKPTFIEKTLEAIGNSQVCYTDMRQFGKFEQEHYKYPDFSSDALKNYQILPSACALCDRHVFEASGGFDPSIVYEDWGWWLRLDQLGFKFTRVPEPLFEYRQHGWSRINELDLQQVKGFAELKEKFGITKKPDKKEQ